MSSSAALLLLADGRFPAGGYAHSGSLEPSIDAGRVSDLPTLKMFLDGRVRTVGLVSAAFAAAACRAVLQRDPDRLRALDAEFDARTPSPAQRSTSRQLGRQLFRVLTILMPDGPWELIDRRAHQPLVLGAGCAGFALTPRDAAVAALHESVAGPVAASVRLLSLDPFLTHAALAGMAPLLDRLAAAAVDCSGEAPEGLPAAAAPLLDLSAEAHASRHGRLFAS